MDYGIRLQRIGFGAATAKCLKLGRKCPHQNSLAQRKLVRLADSFGAHGQDNDHEPSS
jgi:hypothetical protein